MSDVRENGTLCAGFSCV